MEKTYAFLHRPLCSQGHVGMVYLYHLSFIVLIANWEIIDPEVEVAAQERSMNNQGRDWIFRKVNTIMISE